MPIREPAALLFDLGGVLFDVDFQRALRAWQPMSRFSFDELLMAFRFDTRYEQHERGEVESCVYFDHLASVLQLMGSREQIEAGWNAIYGDEIVETTRMIRKARAHLPCFAFTNTNATHHIVWPRIFPDVATAFDAIFASHEIGYRKPERRAFDHVSHAIGVESGSIVFFDDLMENIEGAAAAGLQTVHVRSPNDVRVVLQRMGISLSAQASSD